MKSVDHVHWKSLTNCTLFNIIYYEVDMYKFINKLVENYPEQRKGRTRLTVTKKYFIRWFK